MVRNYYRHFSHALNREMEYLVFGHAGKPLLVFPSQNGRFYDYEDFGMIEVIRPLIEAGKLRVICPDSIDSTSWTPSEIPPRQRIENHERWFDYITNELIPLVRVGNERFIITGCSMGAYHAANFFFRQPKLFAALIALSGIYGADYFFKEYADELTAENSPIDYMQAIKASHPHMAIYRRRKIILCVGQGRWEEDCLEYTQKLEKILEAKKVHAWVDYWGFDVDHDWPWWKKQLPYFIDHVLNPQK